MDKSPSPKNEALLREYLRHALPIYVG